MKKIVATLTALAGITFISGCADDYYNGHYVYAYAYGCGSPAVYSCHVAYGYGSPSDYGYYGYDANGYGDATQLSPGGPAGEAAAIQPSAEADAGLEAAEAPGREAAEAAGQQPTGENLSPP
ncbi:MAG TPA: hypothetical protein VIY49_15890 [Bryobacteraceae bacterium]